MPDFFHAQDAISGKEGRSYTIIDGQVEEMFYCKNIQIDAEFDEAEFKSFGHRGTQTKITGWKGTGSLDIYYATSIFRKIALRYIKTGIVTYFDIQVVNDDPSSSIGKQTVIIRNVTLSKVTMAKLDLDSEFLDESMDFKYSDIDILDEFGKPVLG
ncbi:phage portal protein [Tumebacillus algifaecis]|uniref:Phage portal protein n=1 Tax=Tumebacillus algifaecis TaxID=1214604 RepID=A0A223D5X9_9BACL|nr:phage tail tube protein [Tumebacillus algifaecis]ASS76816.1 phage portal protein [Tumebacillus algifaecis]